MHPKKPRQVLKIVFALILVAGFGGLSCGGPKAFTKGDYDDPTRVELLDDKFNEADMQQMADEISRKVVACKWVTNAPKPPLTIMGPVRNKTEEHIDTVAVTEKIRTSLINTAKIRFIAKESREDLEEEYKYSEGGSVSGPSAIKRGQQLGADYYMKGTIMTNIQKVGETEFIYYKLNVDLVNTRTSTIDCAAEKQIRKKFKKRRI